MKFTAILAAVVAISTIGSSISLPEQKEFPTDAQRLAVPSCLWPKIWWTIAPVGCFCYNRYLQPLCTWPGSWNNNQCKCNCPWWAYLMCAKNQFLNPNTCKCECLEPCRDCSSPQVWSNKRCTCVCPSVSICSKGQFFNYWTCNCECRQKKMCCPNKEPYRVWNEELCDCKCMCMQSCNTAAGFYWDEYLCKCVQKWEVIWSYEAVDKAFEEIAALDGIDPDEIDIADDGSVGFAIE